MMVADRLAQDMFMFASLLRIMGMPALAKNYEQCGVQIQRNPMREVIESVRKQVAELLYRSKDVMRNRPVYVYGENNAILTAGYNHLLSNLTKFSRGELY